MKISKFTLSLPLKKVMPMKEIVEGKDKRRKLKLSHIYIPQWEARSFSYYISALFLYDDHNNQ